MQNFPPSFKHVDVGFFTRSVKNYSVYLFKQNLKRKKTTHTHYKISKMVKMFQLNHGCKSIADVCSWIEWCNKVKFNCENKASTKKQRLDVLLFYGWSLWFRDFILIFFRFKTPKHVSRGLKQRPGENWKCHE